MYIPKRAVPIVIPFFMSMFVSFIVTTTVTIINLGWQTTQLLQHILSAWITVWPIAFGALFVVRPIVERTVKKYTID